MDKPALLWGGRFRTGPSPELMRLSRSGASHFRLVPYDIASSLAHGNELVRAGIVSDGENAEIAAALGQIAADAAAGHALPTERD
jgi:argininosuccinate lyase